MFLKKRSKKRSKQRSVKKIIKKSRKRSKQKKSYSPLSNIIIGSTLYGGILILTGLAMNYDYQQQIDELIENNIKSPEEMIIYEKQTMYNGEYFQRQDGGSSCGRNSLNNLFGHKYFDKKNSKIFNINKNLSIPINLDSFCKFIPQLNRKQFCDNSENYDATFLVYCIYLLGYHCELWDNHVTINEYLTNKITENNVIGFIINYGANHWVCLKKNLLYCDSLGGCSIIDNISYFEKINKKIENIITVIDTDNQHNNFELFKRIYEGKTEDLFSTQKFEELNNLKAESNIYVNTNIKEELIERLHYFIKNSESKEQSRQLFNLIKTKKDDLNKLDINNGILTIEKSSATQNFINKLNFLNN